MKRTFLLFFIVTPALVAAQLQVLAGIGYRLILPSVYNGACQLMSWPGFANNKFAAVPLADWDEGRACGRCVRVSGAALPSDKSQIFYIVDRCDECTEGDLKFSNAKVPVKDVDWTFIDCPAKDIGMTICLKDTNLSNWIAVQAVSTVQGIVGMTINGRITTLEFQNLNTQSSQPSGFYFTTPTYGSLDLSNIHLTITATSGEVVTIESIALRPNTCVTSNIQFQTTEEYTSKLNNKNGAIVVPTHNPSLDGSNLSGSMSSDMDDLKNRTRSPDKDKVNSTITVPSQKNTVKDDSALPLGNVATGSLSDAEKNDLADQDVVTSSTSSFLVKPWFSALLLGTVFVVGVVMTNRAMRNRRQHRTQDPGYIDTSTSRGSSIHEHLPVAAL